MSSLARPLTSINDIFLAIADRGTGSAMQRLVGKDWQTLSGSDVYAQVRAVAAAFANWGLEKGERIALISENRYEWAITDFAALALGLIDVPIFPTLPAGQIVDLLAHSGSRVVVVSTRQQYEKIAAIRARTAIEHVVVMDEVPDADAVTFASLVASAPSTRDASFDEHVRSIRGVDPATIIYTSGTTGEPKGVLLTHGNLASNVNYSLREFDLSAADNAVSFLPLSHVTARHVDYALYILGCTLAYCPALEKLMPTLATIRPTFFVAVPRVFEKLRHEVERKSMQSPMKARIIRWALATGARNRATVLAGRTPTSLLWKLADRLLYSKVRALFGGRVRYWVAGGAPLGLDTAHWFADVGIRIFEGYGLTETSPVIGVNTSVAYRLGSIGRILPNVEARIAEDGELLVRGPSIFSGYWNSPRMTAEAIDAEGWFAPGDIGRIDQDGFLYITDRKKELLKTSAGKMIAPQPIENRLKADLFVGNVALVGDREKYVSALISPNFQALEDWARQQKIPIDSRKAMSEHPEVVAIYKRLVKQVNTTLADFEMLKRFLVVPDEWTQDGGELTPSGKLKRRVILERYQAEIATLYPKTGN